MISLREIIFEYIIIKPMDPNLVDKCKEFLLNPTTNPFTGKKIKKGKEKYNELVEMCEKYRLISLPPPEEDYDERGIFKNTQPLYKECEAKYHTLPEEDKISILTYQGAAGYKKINSSLWANRGIPTHENKFLFDILEKHGIISNTQFLVYRVFQYCENHYCEYVDGMKLAKIGDKIPFYGFLSTSANDYLFKKTPSSAAIIIPKGTKYICPAYHRSKKEEEIIFPPGILTKLKNEGESPLGLWVYEAI